MNFGMSLNFRVRQALVGARIGRFALSARSTAKLLRRIRRSHESGGAAINDELAKFIVTRICSPKKVFVDVGAHIGSILSEVIHFDRSIKIYAVKPIPEKINMLRRKFPTVTFFECALANSQGEASFFVNEKRSGFSSLTRPANNADTVEIKVQLKKLDDLISCDQIDVIKIDVEGAEYDVIRGSEKVIARNRPIILFESGAIGTGDSVSTKRLMWRWLTQRNYDVVVPVRLAHTAPPLTLQMFIDAHFYPMRTLNYFAIPKEHREEIRLRAYRILHG